MMSFDDFYPQKRPYSSFKNKKGQTEGPTDGPTDRRTDTTSYRDRIRFEKPLNFTTTIVPD